MQPAAQLRIERLKTYILGSYPSAASVPGWGRKVYPAASVETIMQTEEELGFPLPELLRAVYAQIGNGWSSFIGLKGGETDEWGNSLEGRYRMVRLPHPDYPECPWPEGLVPMENWGCNIWSCVHCLKRRNPVVRFDPNGIDYENYPESFSNSFSHEAGSLRCWFKAYAERRVSFRPPHLRPRRTMIDGQGRSSVEPPENTKL
jgi:hypothetical protein